MKSIFGSVRKKKKLAIKREGKARKMYLLNGHVAIKSWWQVSGCE